MRNRIQSARQIVEQHMIQEIQLTLVPIQDEHRHPFRETFDPEVLRAESFHENSLQMPVFD
jgi:hypothetical protein